MSITQTVSKFNRQRKWKTFCQQYEITPKTTILDVGVNEEEYSAIDNFLEKNYPYQQNITALSIDKPIKFSARYPQINAIQYDGTHFPFSDNTFDICWSNAVIEHVGDNAKQISFLKEIRRTSRSAFITTPNKYFPIEVHTRTPLLHLLPKSFFYKYLRLINKEWATGNYMNLLSINDIKRLMQAANITDYKIKKNKLFFFTLDFIITF